jgi:hypothetical protein
MTGSGQREFVLVQIAARGAGRERIPRFAGRQRPQISVGNRHAHLRNGLPMVTSRIPASRAAGGDLLRRRTTVASVGP